MTTIRRLRPLLKCNKENVPLLLVLAQLIHDKMVANQTLFGAPTVSMTVFAGQIADLSGSQQQLKNRQITAAQRNVKRDVVWTSLGSLLQYVQGLCDEAGEQAAGIISAAGMKIAAVPTSPKPVLAVKLGVASGSAILRANARLLAAGRKKKGRFFEWQYTLDGKTFVSVPSTAVAHTTLAGLPPLTTVGFRVCLVDSSGPGEWSQVERAIIH
jgi:hypothetical protein